MAVFWLEPEGVNIHDIKHQSNPRDTTFSSVMLFIVQDYNIDSGFPYLNSVMTTWWSEDPNQRPSAADVTRMMLNTEFLENCGMPG